MSSFNQADSNNFRCFCRGLFPGILVVALFLVSQAVATDINRANSPPLELHLGDAVAMAKSSNPLSELGRLEVNLAKEKSSEISGKFLSPNLHLESYSGLISGARGDITSSPDTIDQYNDLGPFFKIDLKVIQPIYSFGKYSSATEAGRYSVLVQEAMLQQSQNDLAFQVIKSFLGMVAGRDGIEVGKKLTEHYNTLVLQLEQMLEKNEPEITDSHLLETRSMGFEITKQAGLGRSEQNQAALMLKGLLNLTPETVIQVVPPNTPYFKATKSLLTEILEYAHKHSWQLQMLDSGLAALKEKTELESNMKHPDLFLAAGAGYGRAPNRDKQTNPFIYDEYNYEKAGAVFGLKWDFNYQTRTSVEKQAVIDYLKLVEKKKIALLQLDGEIREAFLAAERHWLLLIAAGESLKSAKQWIRLENDNLDMGIGDVKRLISAYKQYFLLQADEIETRYNYHINLAQLAKIMGSMDLYLQWENNGQVLFN